MIITICRKPFKRSVCESIVESQCGGINIKKTRIDGSEGRFPANVVITDCPSVLVQFPKDSLGCKPHRVVGNNRYEGWGTITAKDEVVGYDDGENTCASRYFFKVRK